MLLKIVFQVAGLPPVTSGTKPVLAPDHPHAPRVLALLDAAREVRERTGWIPESSKRIRLELTVHGAGQAPGEPINTLDAVVDVLADKDKDWAVNLDHLGDMDQVSLYDNRGQVTEVAYREAAGEQASYSVRLFRLDGHPSTKWSVEPFLTVQCPEPDASLHDVLFFAVTYDTYRRLASDMKKLKSMVDPVVQVLDAGEPIPDWVGTDILRGILFGCQRASHWQGYVSAEDEERMRRLIRAIWQRSGESPLVWDDNAV